MKSMLHEASSVIKAVEKAWADSGRPSEFTVTVHEIGEKNFFGFTKVPAIVSITYDPNKVLDRQRDKKVTASSQQQQKPQKLQQSQPRRQENVKRELPAQKQAQSQAQAEPRQRVQFKEAVAPKERPILEQDEGWNDEWVGAVAVWLKELVVVMGMSPVFATKFDNRMLTVTFEESLLETAEEEKMLFISLSYLLMQFLKKKYKKKLRGYHLIITTKTTAAHDQRKTASTY
jgi:predicted RNA-binding protein Jag